MRSIYSLGLTTPKLFLNPQFYSDIPVRSPYDILCKIAVVMDKYASDCQYVQRMICSICKKYTEKTVSTVVPPIQYSDKNILRGWCCGQNQYEWVEFEQSPSYHIVETYSTPSAELYGEYTLATHINLGRFRKLVLYLKRE